MIRTLFLCAALVPVVACNSSAGVPLSPITFSATPPIVLAQGGSCNASIARYRAVAKSDAETGNANASVYAQIDREIGNAEAACAAGRDGEAQRQIAASKARHGYPSGN